jgi:hypothetical protein
MPRKVSVVALLIAWFASLGSTALAGTAGVDLTPTKINVDGSSCYSLGFDKLSAFDYKVSDVGTGATPDEIAKAMKTDQVPSWIHIYDNQEVVLSGYMMPLQVENGLSTKFVMMRDITTCCYGAVPNMNDYVVVTVQRPGIQVVQDIPVRMLGKFRIDQRYDGGYVVSLFVMDGQKFLGPVK